MSNVFDVATYILASRGQMSAMKLQKLVYYCQAWSLVWEDRPLFDERIEAWANGPVVRALYDRHQGQFLVNADMFVEHGTEGVGLDGDQRETIDIVLDAYGDKSAQWLSDQTHSEDPWLKARAGLPDNARGDHEVTLESMAEYYSSL